MRQRAYAPYSQYPVGAALLVLLSGDLLRKLLGNRVIQAIERLMAKPEAGYNGLVYFQLRSLWRACFDQLGVFAEELRKQQEDRERKKQLQNFNKDRAHRMDEINDLIRRVKDEADEIAGEIGGLESRESRLRGFWKYFRRREVAARLGERKSEHASARTRI